MSCLFFPHLMLGQSSESEPEPGMCVTVSCVRAGNAAQFRRGLWQKIDSRPKDADIVTGVARHCLALLGDGSDTKGFAFARTKRVAFGEFSNFSIFRLPFAISSVRQRHRWPPTKRFCQSNLPISRAATALEQRRGEGTDKAAGEEEGGWLKGLLDRPKLIGS